ncbi:MAG: cytochrome b [Roseicyclus sp.]
MPSRTPTDGRPVSYSTVQMSLHWLVVFLVIVQFVFNDSVEAALERAAETGAYAWMEGGLITHPIVGTAIFLAMAARLWLRLTRGVPPAPTTEPRPVQILSRTTHWAFYAILLAMPVVGALALVLASPVLGQVHTVTAWALLGLIALHVAGALWHAVRSDSKAHRRMLAQRPSEVRLD